MVRDLKQRKQHDPRHCFPRSPSFRICRAPGSLFFFFFSRGTATEIPRTTYPARPVAASVVPAGTLLGENCTVRVHFATAAFSLGSRAHPRDAVGLEGCQLFLAELNLLVELARVHEQLGFDADKAIVVCTFVGSQITAQQ